MTTPLDYQAPSRRRPKAPAPWVAVILLIAGCGALLFGGTLAVCAAVELRHSQTEPSDSWGPRGYVFDVLKGFVYLGLILVPTGVVFVLVAVRKLRSRRGA